MKGFSYCKCFKIVLNGIQTASGFDSDQEGENDWKWEGAGNLKENDHWSSRNDKSLKWSSGRKDGGLQESRFS